MGKVAVAAMPSFAGNRLPAALRAFRDAYPRVNVAVHDVINEQVMEMVRDGRVELGIAFEPTTLDGLQFTPCTRAVSSPWCLSPASWPNSPR